MGLLDSLLGGSRGGGMSKISLALLALLAYRAYQNKGGKSGAGGLGDILGRLGGGDAPGRNPSRHAPSQGDPLSDLLSGGLGGALGSLLGGGAAGGLLSGGLSDLLKQFQEQGNGDIAESWIGKGPNKKISAGEIEATLGEEQINSLAEQAGLSRMDLLAGLSEHLPDFVDRLTPDGRIPTEQEAARMI